MDANKIESARILLRPREVADAIGVSRTSAYELISSGAIPSCRIGNFLRVPAEALKRLIDERVTALERR
jgi:excisionase family DNA binding protein